MQPKRQPMQLREIVEKYLAAAGGYGHSVALSSLGFSRAEIEQVFSIYDEDYHISRFFHLSAQPAAESYNINGFPQTHVTIDAEIQRIL
jgi:hypothetical protein